MISIKDRKGKLKGNTGKVSLLERRRFLHLGLKITGVLAGGSILSLMPAERAKSKLLGTGVVGTYPYQPHYAMLIYNDRCIDCQRCITACKQTNDVQSYGSRITILWRKLTGVAASKMIREFLPVLCNQCNRPPCVKVCPTKASYKNKKNGIVMIKEPLCIGCKACMTACPYNALYYNRETESVDKCDFCFRKILENDISGTPACVAACPADALFFGDLSDEKSEIYSVLHKPEQEIFVLRPESNSVPNVFYLQEK